MFFSEQKDLFYINELEAVLPAYLKKKKNSKQLIQGPNPHPNIYEMLFFLSGKEICKFEGKEYYNCENSIRLYPPSMTKKTTHITTLEPGKGVHVYFRSLASPKNGIFTLDTSPDPMIKKLFIRLQNHWLYKKEGYYYDCLSILFEIFSRMEVLNSQHQFSNPEHLKKIEPAVQHIHEHYFEPDFSCTVLPTMCSMSYTYFRKLFLQKFNMTPARYVTQLKMERACELLAKDNYSIQTVSALLGYHNPNYFSNVFKSVYGCSPKRYLAAEKESK